MKRHLIPVVLFLASAAFAAAGAGGQKSNDDDHGVLRAIAEAPEVTREWVNPYEGRADAIAAGKKLYLRHCAECHGREARGSRRAVSLRSPGVQNATAGELVWFLRNGNLWRGMPSWSGLPEQRRWQIVTYLKTLR